MSMSCFDCHDYMDGYNRGKKEGTIEELENIKADLDKIPDDEWGLVSAIEVVENRIVELKGENK